MAETQIFEADWTWTGLSFEAGIRVAVGEDGRIAAVGPGGPAPTLRLPGRALLPGFVSAHSHAFQRGLRGRGERFPAGAGSFWTWRQAMYDLVGSLESGELERLCRRTFREMRRAGVTAVGEFHYLHHGAEEEGYAFDAVVLEAARQAGIRIALLEVYYRTGDIGQPLEGPQRRFGSPSPEIYWGQVDRLAGVLDRRTQSLGASVHSLRAASPEESAEIYDEARRRGLPFHIHVEEQRREIASALAFYGQRPMTLLLEALGTAEDMTAVHCTHTDPEDLQRFLAAGGTVCVCPLTEGNLGDGLPSLPDARPGSVCLGSDSNARISLLEEMRWLEYGQRLRGESRGAFDDGAGHPARALLAAATEAGARSIGVEAGKIAPGLWADLAAIDLDAPTLEGWEPGTLLDSLIYGAAEEAIAGTAVGGRWEWR
jgi:formimidoylglutamate deiminase